MRVAVARVCNDSLQDVVRTVGRRSDTANGRLLIILKHLLPVSARLAEITPFMRQNSLAYKSGHVLNSQHRPLSSGLVGIQIVQNMRLFEEGALQELGKVEVRWLTYWWDNAWFNLAPALGIKDFPVAPIGKLGMNEEILTKHKYWERPIVWIDDEISDELSELAAGLQEKKKDVLIVDTLNEKKGEKRGNWETSLA